MVPVDNHFSYILRFRLSPAHSKVFRIAFGLHLLLKPLGVNSGSRMNSFFRLLLLKVGLEVSLLEYPDCLINFLDIVLPQMFRNVSVIDFFRYQLDPADSFYQYARQGCLYTS